MTYSHTVFIVSAATAAIYLPIPIIQPTEALCKGLLLALFYAEERTSSVHITVEAQFDENHNREAHHCEMRRWLACVTVRHILWSLAGRVSSSRRLPAFGKSWHPREWCDCVEISAYNWIPGKRSATPCEGTAAGRPGSSLGTTPKRADHTGSTTDQTQHHPSARSDRIFCRIQLSLGLLFLLSGRTKMTDLQPRMTPSRSSAMNPNTPY